MISPRCEKLDSTYPYTRHSPSLNARHQNGVATSLPCLPPVWPKRAQLSPWFVSFHPRSLVTPSSRAQGYLQPICRIPVISAYKLSVESWFDILTINTDTQLRRRAKKYCQPQPRSALQLLLRFDFFAGDRRMTAYISSVRTYLVLVQTRKNYVRVPLALGAEFVLLCS